MHPAGAERGTTVTTPAEQRVLQLMIRVGGLPRLFKAAQKGKLARVNAHLATDGVDVDQTDACGVTPLAIAAKNGFVDVIGALLGAGADPNRADAEQGYTPLL
jgi:ankyrin repeat protein